MRRLLMGVGLVWSVAALAAGKTLIVGAGDCRDPELISGVNDFSLAMRERVKGDLYDPDVVFDIVRPRPTRTLDDVQRQVESARVLFYNGQNERALDLLRQALSELERAPVSGEPWKLAATAHTLKAMILLAMGRKSEAIEAMRTVLRVEPSYALSREEFAPSVVSQFETLRKELAKAKKFVVQIQSTPSAAEVFVEGRLVGTSPLKLELSGGSYRLMIRSAERASFMRVVSVPRETAVQVDFGVEGALSTQTPLCLTAVMASVAESAALKLATTVSADELVIVRREGSKGMPGHFVATRYELRTGTLMLEGRVQTPTRGKPAFGELAQFLITGQGNAMIVTPEATSPDAKAVIVESRPPPASAASGEKPMLASRSPPSAASPGAPSPSKTPGALQSPSGGGAGSKERGSPVSAAPSAERTESLNPLRFTGVLMIGLGVMGVVGTVLVDGAGGPARTRLTQITTSSGKYFDPSRPEHREAVNVVGPQIENNRVLGFATLAAGVGLFVTGVSLLALFGAESSPAAVSVLPLGDGGSVWVSAPF